MITDDGFVLYAMRHYDNPSCKTINEFNEDMNRFKYLSKVLNRYSSGEQVDLRIALNHIMIIINVFGVDGAVNMLFFKLDKKHWSILKTFLVGLSVMPEYVVDVGVTSSDIPVDYAVVNFMRGI